MKKAEHQGWKTESSEILGTLREIALGNRRIFFQAVSDRVAFGLSGDKEADKRTLGLYQPMLVKARVAAKLLRVVSAAGIPRFFGKVPKIGITDPELSWFRNNLPCGFLGCNPAHGLRVVLVHREEGNDGDWLVTKLGAGGKLDGLIHESELLRKIGGKVSGVPSCGGRESGEGWMAFKSPYFGKAFAGEIKDARVIALLKAWVSKDRVTVSEWLYSNGFQDGMNSEMMKQLSSLKVCLALMHGDFTPWNLREVAGEIVAIDWEYGREQGLSGLDLGHGLLLKERLISGDDQRTLVESLRGSYNGPEISGYLASCGWANFDEWLLVSALVAQKTTGVSFQDVFDLILKGRS